MNHESDEGNCAALAKSNAVQIGRRSFIGAVLGASAMVVGAIVGTPLLRYVLYPVYAKSSKSEWADVGELGEFDKAGVPVSKTISLVQRDGWREVVSSQSVYVNRLADGKLQVLSAICPHLGCSVAWQPSQGKFVCPCHGGQFSPEGRHLAGPPPRGLDSLKAQVKDGKLQVQFEYFRSNLPDQQSLS